MGRTSRVCVELGGHLKVAVGQIWGKRGSLCSEAPPFPSVSGVAFVLPRVSVPQSCAKIYVLEGQSKGVSFLLGVWGYICPQSLGWL